MSAPSAPQVIGTGGATSHRPTLRTRAFRANPIDRCGVAFPEHEHPRPLPKTSACRIL